MEMNKMLPDLIFKLGKFVDNQQKRRAELEESGVKIFNPVKQLWWVPVIVCLTLLLTRPTKSNLTKKTQLLPVDIQLTVGNKKINLERPLTLEQRNIGLMGRKTIPDDRGMLILLTDIARPYKANMTNIGFPIDFIFVNGVTIVNVTTLQPCSGSCPIIEIEDKSSFLIQVKAGTAQRLGLKQGSKIKISKKENS